MLSSLYGVLLTLYVAVLSLYKVIFTLYAALCFSSSLNKVLLSFYAVCSSLSGEDFLVSGEELLKNPQGNGHQYI